MNKSLFDTNLKSLENFILNSAPDISYSNFVIAILVSALLAFIVKLAYIRISRTLNDREYFSDIFVPLAIITTLVITVIKFSLALSGVFEFLMIFITLSKFSTDTDNPINICALSSAFFKSNFVLLVTTSSLKFKKSSRNSFRLQVFGLLSTIAKVLKP